MGPGKPIRQYVWMMIEQKATPFGAWWVLAMCKTINSGAILCRNRLDIVVLPLMFDLLVKYIYIKRDGVVIELVYFDKRGGGYG